MFEGLLSKTKPATFVTHDELLIILKGLVKPFELAAERIMALEAEVKNLKKEN